MNINDWANSIGDGLANGARVIKTTASNALFSWIPGYTPAEYHSVQESNDTGAEISEAITTYGPAYVDRGTLAQDAEANKQQSLIAVGVIGLVLILVLSIFRR